MKPLQEHALNKRVVKIIENYLDSLGRKDSSLVLLVMSVQVNLIKFIEQDTMTK